LNRSSEQTAVIVATQAILYFMMAFACNDQARNLKGKLPQIEYWKTTCEFIGWVITLQKERNEPELEGLWYYNLGWWTDKVINYKRFASNGCSRMNFSICVIVRKGLKDNGARRERNRLRRMICFGGYGQSRQSTTPPSEMHYDADNVNSLKSS
jgi:hypothetical protein